MQSEPRTPVIAARREEWIERLMPHVEGHPAAIVGENHQKA
jgi:hypothetical protein